MSESTSKESHADHVDHGYAWVITFIGFMWNIIISVVFKSLGVLHIQIEELFGQSAFKTSLVAFVMTICWLVFSPLGGYLAYRWSYRITIGIGGMLTLGKRAILYFSQQYHEYGYTSIINPKRIMQKILTLKCMRFHLI